MKILFIIFETNMYPRIGIMFLAANLKAHGHVAQMLDSKQMSRERLYERIAGIQPDIVAYSISTGEHVEVLAFNRELKKRLNFMAVFGGPHATFSPEMIEEEESCDAICIGEGDTAFPEFCRRIEAGEAYWESPNFHVRHEGVIHKNPLLPLITNLDELPYADHDLMYECDPDLAREGVKSFYGTRGCPYDCTYCFNRQFNEMYRDLGPILRHRSPEHLIAEICHVKENYPLRFVLIQDDTFALKPKGWMERFCALYKEKVNLPFGCTVRSNVVRERDIALLADAGLRLVWTGVECGDDEVADRVLGRAITGDQIVEASRILQKYGVLIVATNLLGLPVKNAYEVDLRTLDLNMRIRPTYALSGLLYPYPGTPVRALAEREGFLPNGEVPILETNKRSSVFTFSSDMEKRRVENLHKLFDWIVRFPWLRKHCDFLCSLPLTPLYRLFYYARFGYMYKWVLFPFQSPLKEFGMWFRFFSRRLRRS